MKVEDSSMPEEAYWNSLFDIAKIVDWLNLTSVTGPIVEIGCGYGTFTIPVAKKIDSVLMAFDIEQPMIVVAMQRAQQAGLTNIQFNLRDILEHGTDIPNDSVAMVLLFNILHSSERRKLLEEASRILKPGGIVAIIHWRKDIETPRGPAVALRPDLETILKATSCLDLHFAGNSTILGPYHWGMQLTKGGDK